MPFPNCVIYKTVNLINNKIYVGKDSNNNSNYLGSGIILKKAIKKYGKENFKKNILESCDLSNINKREIYWIAKLNSINPKIGYNITPGGDGVPKGMFTGKNSPHYGKKKPKEEIACLTEAARKHNIGRCRSEETKKKISLKSKGRTHTEETKRKIALANSGEKNGWFGKKRHLSDETKRKISLKMKNRSLSESHKKKLSLSHINKILSEEHRKNISLGLRHHYVV